MIREFHPLFQKRTGKHATGTILACVWQTPTNLRGCDLEKTSFPEERKLKRLKWRLLCHHKRLLLLSAVGCAQPRVTTPKNTFRVRIVGLWLRQQMARPLHVSGSIVGQARVQRGSHTWEHPPYFSSYFSRLRAWRSIIFLSVTFTSLT